MPCMFNLAIDIGNTYTKVGLFKGSELIEAHFELNEDTLLTLVKQLSFKHVILSSVAALPEALIRFLTATPSLIQMGADTKLPFVNLYHTPQTLGNDRKAAVAGGAFLYPARPVLAIDMGTCVKVDFIDHQNRYHGGSIAPGLRMRLQAMHTFTARLPLVNTENVAAEQIALIGKSTQEAIRSGAVHGLGAEITQMIRMYADKFADLQVVICGGDAAYLTKIIQPEHIMIPELTLIGLNRILIHNVSQN